MRRVASSGRHALLVLLVAALSGCCGLGNTGPTGSRCESLYLTMRDGVRIAIDAWLPEGLDAGERLPTVIMATRYWRGLDLKLACFEEDPAWAEAAFFNGHGYALIIVDARGTGASYGRQDYPFSDAEIADYGEVLDWIFAQVWSNGRVGAYGVSYVGATAELMASLDHDALTAVVPCFADFDVYADILRPGGLLNEGFLRSWSEGNQALDANDICAVSESEGLGCLLQRLVVAGVKPVDEDPSGDLLAAAVDEHQGNIDVFETAAGITYKDDLFNTVPAETLGAYAQREAIERAGVPYLAWASWLDAATAHGALGRFMTFSNPQRLIIGPWNHSGDDDVDPFAPRDDLGGMSSEAQRTRIIEFLDAYVRDGVAPASLHEVQYYTLNEGAWRTATEWPPAGVEERAFYLRTDGALSAEPPGVEEGHDGYVVDFNATTGRKNRWYRSGGDWRYEDRAGEDSRLLTYTSPPFDSDVEITGHPVVTLFLDCSEADAALFVYLEIVSEDGAVTYVTEGQVRLIHRKVGAAPPHAVFGPYHSFRSDDAESFVPGVVNKVELTLLPTSVFVERGARLRVAVAGHDNGTFGRVPATGDPVIDVYHDASRPSSILVPAIGR